MSHNRFRLIFLSSAIAVSAVSQADITFYDLFKNAAYGQTSAAQPTTAYSWDFGARIFSNADGDVTAGNVDLPVSVGGSISLSAAGPRSAQLLDYGYADQAAIDAAYPDGTYDYSVTSGTLAGQSGSLTVPVSVYSDQVPYLTGSSFADLQSATAGNSVNVTWDAYTVSSTPTYQLVYFNVFDFTTSSYVVDASGTNGVYGSQSIDGSVLVAGHHYGWSLYFDPRFEWANSGFNGTAASIVGFDRVTNGDFTVAAVPEPASFAVLGLGALGILKRRRR